MCGTRVLRSLAAILAAVLVICSYSTSTVAQTVDQQQEARTRILQQRIDELDRELKAIKEEQAKSAKTLSTVDKAWNTFIKGFFGTLDVSLDATTKGMSGMVAYTYTCTPSGFAPCTQGPAKNNGAGPFGKVGWMPMMSSNGSNVGYRGSHRIGTSSVDFIYQVSTSLDMAAAPGLRNSQTKSSNTVEGAIGLGDTFIGLRQHNWGTLKFGEMYTPYKTSTDRLNPFPGMLGNYSVIMGNTGGDNRIEWGTRMDHVIAYNSPNMSGISFDVAYALGQNVDPYNNVLPLGSPDCSGSNSPGSGNLFLNCDDGGFNYAISGDLKFEFGGLYLVAAYELHNNVNRSSDGVGSNSPVYATIPGVSNLCNTAGPGPVSPLLDCSTYLTYAASFPSAAALTTPGFNPVYDAVNEYAYKLGGQYHFQFGLTISYMWEELHRTLGQELEFQNERQRNGQWLAMEYEFPGGADRIAVGWAHAGATVGDPGGQHNYNQGLVGQNEANMVTAAYWHKFDKQLTWYFNFADTTNDGNAHFDIGAGSHGIKTDCHDATHTPITDYTSAGNTTWGGCHPIGFSTGLNFKF